MIKLIQLTPLSDFFFGGENTFGQGENRHYFVRSNQWPQQTSLLGMLRYELLKSEPKAFDIKTDSIINHAEAYDLIGQNGFDGISDDVFGIINGISPVFLMNNGVPYFLSGKLTLKPAKSADSVEGETTLKAQKGFKSLNLLKEAIVDRPSDESEGFLLHKNEASYDGKTSFQQHLISSDGKIVPLSKVFLPVEKTNNRKEYNGSTDDSGFFKQNFWKLEKGWSMCFLASFNTALPEAFGTHRTAQLGAERRLFALDISDAASNNILSKVTFKNNSFEAFETIYPSNPRLQVPDGYTQIILLSDACAEPDINRSSDFIYSNSIPFKFIQANLKDPNKVWKIGSEPKSERRNLLQRGSVFVTKSPAFIQQHLLTSDAFRRIGYNYFKTITA